MAGALSGHLINGHQPNNPFNSSIVSHEAMSFNPMMHGTPFAQQSFSLFGSQPSFANDSSMNEATAHKIALLQAKLNQKLGPEFISQRQGPGGPKLTYAEGWKIINLANEVFGFNGWSSSIVSLTTDFVDYTEESRRYNIGVTAIVRVTLRDGVFHEDIGYGMAENVKGKGQALDKCKKEAVTDGIKRALRNFGNLLGNCLYDKSYTAEVVKIKVPPARFNKDELHRRPEFEDIKPDLASTSASGSSSTSAALSGKASYPDQANTITPIRPSNQQNKVLSSVPLHIRSEIQHSPSTTNNYIHQSNDIKGKGPAQLPQSTHGLNTPITTPLHSLPQRGNMPPPRLPVVKPQASGVQSAIKLDPDYSTEFDAFDSVGFGSDDSVFFALADLGPPIDQEDVGRPIQTDGDEGRPINQDEGLMESMNDDSDEGPAAAQAPMPKSNATAPSRHELIAAALMSSGNEESNGNSSPSDSRQGQPSNVPVKSTTSVPATAGMLTKPLLPKPVLATSATVKSNHSSHLQSHTNSNASSSTARFMPPQQQNNQGSKSHVQQQHQRYMIMKQEQIQNQTSSTDSATSGEAVKRPATPSIGGFNFPPNANNPLQNVPGAHSTSSGIGVKRPAEAMGSTSYRGGRPGMGLQQPAPPGPSTVNGRREVFGRLDVGEGGDVKRMRR